MKQHWIWCPEISGHLEVQRSVVKYRFRIIPFFLSMALLLGLQTCLNGNLLSQEKVTISDPVRLCVDPDWEPYERLLPTGEYVGIAADLLAIAFKRAGVRYSVVPTLDWDHTLESARNGDCDAIGFLNQTAERDKWMIFTDPYFTDPNVIITRTEHSYIANLAGLTGETMALIRGTSVIERVRRDFPGIQIIEVETERDAFAAVERGRADMTIRSLTVAAYTIRNEGWFNLKVSGEVPEYRNELRIGILQNNVELRDTLDEAIATITPQEVQDVTNRHISLEVAYEIDHVLIWRIVGTFSIGIIIIILWILFERKHNRRLTAVNISLHESEERYRLLVETAMEGIAVIQDGAVVYANREISNMLGRSLEELQSLPSFMEVVAPEYRELAAKNHSKQVAGEYVQQRYELFLTRANGDIFPVEVSGTPIKWQNQPAALNVFMDITDRKQTEEQIRHLALHDPLTGLPNRRLLMDRMEQAIKTARRANGHVGLLFVDLNGFKSVNDTYGHETGDRLLQAVATRLLETLRTADTVARVGGDEFVILLPSISGPMLMTVPVEHIRAALAEPFQLDKLELTISGSVGAACFPDDGQTADLLLQKADSEMYRHKRG